MRKRRGIVVHGARIARITDADRAAVQRFSRPSSTGDEAGEHVERDQVATIVRPYWWRS